MDGSTRLPPKHVDRLIGLLPPAVDGRTILLPANAHGINRPASSTYGSLNVSTTNSYPCCAHMNGDTPNQAEGTSVSKTTFSKYSIIL